MNDILLQAALNGARTPADHPAVPLTPDQLAADSLAAVEAGAGALHIHPRNAGGVESLAGDDVDAAVIAVRNACPDTPIGLTTAAWIVPSVDERLAFLDTWTVLPDFASVNFYESGAEEVAELLLSRGIGFEAGLNSADAAHRFLDFSRSREALRVLIEPDENDPKEARAAAAGIIEILDLGMLDRPRLLHGSNDAAWSLLRQAIELGYDTRIGFEDTLRLPNGRPAQNNLALIEAAIDLIQRHK